MQEEDEFFNKKVYSQAEALYLALITTGGMVMAALTIGSKEDWIISGIVLILMGVSLLIWIKKREGSKSN